MKTYKLKIISLAIVSVLLSSCTRVMFTSLDVLRPAQIAFAPQASNLLIVNNAVIQPSDFGHKTTLLNAEPKKIVLPADSLAIFCLGALTEDLQGKDFFSSIKLLPKSTNTHTNFSKTYPLNKNTVTDLCLKYHANTILSLNNIKVNDDLSEYYLPETSTYLGTLEFRIETSWSVHYLKSKEVTAIQFKDTVYWESESYVRRKALGDLPKRSDAMVDAALNVGHKSVNRFVPYWDKADRYFFNPRNKLMKLGMDSVYVKNWNAAIISWKKAMEKSKSDWIQAQAANNIAIAYEILGDIDNALEYATIAYYSMGKLTFADFESFNRIAEYINELTQRKKDILILKKQLGE